MLCSGFSTRLMISRSTVSGEAPGYGKEIDITGFSTSGIWLTRRFFSASNPRHMSTITIATVVTGCLILKLERNMGLLLRYDGRHRSATALHGLAVLQRGARIPQHLVALGETAAQRKRTGTRVAITERQRDLLQLLTAHAPRIYVVALAHDGCAGKTQCRAAASLDVSFGIQACDVGLFAPGIESHEHFDLARGD